MWVHSPYYNLGSTLNNSQKTGFAIFGLLFGATCWGAIWYPYRLLADAGVSGVASSFYTYGIATLIAASFSFKHWRGLFTQPQSVIWLGITAGITNMSYVLSVIDGEVMRTMLLFYLSPLWTLLLARFWLKETITKAGVISITVSLIGAYIMLAGPFSAVASHVPVPRNLSEWLAVLAGIGFSLSNVITRKASHLSLRAKSFTVWMGVMGSALLVAAFFPSDFPAPQSLGMYSWLIMCGIAILLILATLFVQFGITQLSAIRASVLFLFELIVAAVAAYYLAGEQMQLNEWIGGGLIIIASFIAALNHQDTH
jgi:drug/metabolite transporter (DMT)-like permease